MIAIGVAGVVALAFLVEGALGFGATLVALSLGAFLVPVGELLPALLPLNIALSASLVWRGRSSIDRALLLRRILPLMICGAPVGFFGLAHLPTIWAARAFGVVVVALAAFALTRRQALPTLAAPALFFLGGVVHGAFGTGGPLVVAGVADRDKGTLRATLSALWLLMNVVLLAAFAMDARLSSHTLALLAPAAAGAVAGGVAGVKLHDFIDARAFTRVVWLALAAAGALLCVG